MLSHSSHKIAQAFEILGRTPSTPGEIDGTLEHIICRAQEFFESDLCTISAFNPTTRGLISSKAIGQSLTQTLAFDHEEIAHLTQQVLQDGMLLVNDIDILPEQDSILLRQEGIRAFISLSLSTRHRQRLLGVITFYFRRSCSFSEHEIEHFCLYARGASFLLQATWQEYHYEEVSRIGQNINHNLSTPEDLFQELQTYVQNILDESHTFLLAVYNQQTDTMDFYREEPGLRITSSQSMVGACEYVVKTQESIYIKQLSMERDHLPYQIVRVPDTELKESLIFVPVTLRGVSLGVLSIQHSAPNSYGQNDLFILKLLATHIALALHNMRLYNNLGQLNKAGRLLTQQPDSEQALSTTAQNILNATSADIVILYPYDARRRQFIFPPIVAGSVHEASIMSMSLSQPLLAELVLLNDKTIFAQESIDAYKQSQAKIWQDNFQQREQIASVAAIPLKDRDEPVGVLFVNFHRTQYFDSSQKLLIEGLASFAAIAIRNAQVYGSLNFRRATELEILQNIDSELNRILELEPVLTTILEAADRLLKADCATIMLYDPQTSLLKTAAVLGRSANEESRSITIHMQDARGITGWVLQNKRPALVNNINDPNWQDIYFPSTADIVSELDVPLLDGEEAIGVLNFESTREGAFSEEDKAFLLNLAGQTVLAIKNAQSYERERRLADERRILNEISKEITRQFDPVEVFKLILDKALELTHSAYGTLWLYDPDQNDLWMAAERGVGGERTERMSLDQGVVGYVARKKQLLNVDPTESPWNQIYLPFLPGTRSELTVAMLARDDLRGVLNIESAIPNNFDDGYERLMVGLSDMAVIALQNAERYQETQREARRFELLYQIEQQLGKLTEIAQIQLAYDIITGLVEKSEQCHVNIYRYNETTQQLVSINVSPRYDDPFLQVNIDEAIHEQVMHERRMVIIYDANTHAPGVTVKRESVTRHSLVIAPIIFNDKYYGNLEISHENVGHLRATNIHFLERLTQQLSSTIANTLYRLEIAEQRQESEKRALSAEEMSSIGQLAYELTHRVGNDLGLVESYVNDIRDELDIALFRSNFIGGKLEKIVRSAKRILDLSRELKHEMIRTGNAMADTPTLIEPGILFADVIEEFKDRLAQRPDIQIEIDNAHDVGVVRVLRSSIMDLLHNLIINAIEAMQEGGKLTLRAYTTGAYVALAISDTGIGIAPEKQAKVFELSFSTKGSSGFGLWSALRNARRNSGLLSVASIPGQGTTFTLLLPKINEQKTQTLQNNLLPEGRIHDVRD